VHYTAWVAVVRCYFPPPTAHSLFMTCFSAQCWRTFKWAEPFAKLFWEMVRTSLSLSTDTERGGQFSTGVCD
jgi:hypothetical protein